MASADVGIVRFCPAWRGRVVRLQVEMEMKRQAKLRQLTDDVSSDVMHRPTLNALSVRNVVHRHGTPVCRRRCPMPHGSRGVFALR